MTRLLLACGAIGPPVSVVLFLLEGAARPGYDAWHHFVSSLSQGERGWIQIANFIACGTLVICFAVGLRRVLQSGRGSTWGPILLGLFGLCLIRAGVFVTDPLLGYPPGMPSTRSVPGAIHVLLSAVVFGSLAAACFVMARRFVGEPGRRGWAIYSAATGNAGHSVAVRRQRGGDAGSRRAGRAAPAPLDRGRLGLDLSPRDHVAARGGSIATLPA